jgi:transcriptional regulator with XRE-family HTH domain
MLSKCAAWLRGSIVPPSRSRLEWEVGGVPHGYLLVGERIRHRRRARGLSQLRLAGLIDRTEDWVSKVERGEIPVDRVSVLVRVADALKVPLSYLLGEQSWSGERSDPPNETAGLCKALSTLPGLPKAVPRILPALKAELLAVTRLRADARYAATAAALPSLVNELDAAVEASEGEQRREAFGLLARAYGLAVATLIRYRENDLAWVAGDRGVHAAESTHDPVERTLSAYRLALAFVGAGRLVEAVYVVEAALERATVAERSTDLRALRGALYLPLAVAHARKGDQARASEALRDAERTAAGPDGATMAPDLQLATQFGPANVLAHQVSVAVDLGDAGRALAVAPKVEQDELSVSRYTRHLLDVAIAHNYRRDTPSMVGKLLEVQRLAPEQLNHFPGVREMLLAALRRERGPRDANLHRLADALGPF